MFQALRLYLENMETVTDSLGSQKRTLPEYNPADLLTCSGLRARGSAQVRAATAPVQRRKQILEREVFVADYISNLR